MNCLIHGHPLSILLNPATRDKTSNQLLHGLRSFPMPPIHHTLRSTFFHSRSGGQRLESDVSGNLDKKHNSRWSDIQHSTVGRKINKHTQPEDCHFTDNPPTGHPARTRHWRSTIPLPESRTPEWREDEKNRKWQRSKGLTEFSAGVQQQHLQRRKHRGDSSHGAIGTQPTDDISLSLTEGR